MLLTRSVHSEGLAVRFRNRVFGLLRAIPRLGLDLAGWLERSPVAVRPRRAVLAGHSPEPKRRFPLYSADLASRLANRIQLTSDGHEAYLEAVEGAFGGDIDYAMLVKLYGESPKKAA
jgi:hypothetical protein